MTTARELTNRMAAMLDRELGSLADFLLTFSGFHAEKRWRELDYGSGFAYLRGEFKLSEGAAYNRLVGAELVHRIPEVEEAIRSRKLCFSAVHEVAKILTPENQHELLPRFFHKSRRDAAQLAAALRPAEVIPVREIVTPIRSAAVLVPPVAAAHTSASPNELTLAMVTTDAVELPPREAAGSTPALELQPAEVNRPSRVGASLLRLVAEPPRDEVEPLATNRARMHFTVDDDFLAELESAKNELAHACPSGSAVELLRYCLRFTRAEHAKRQGRVEKPLKKARPCHTNSIPAHVKRAVWERAGGRCEFILASGERCDCRRMLQYDHIEPVALGGKSTIENVRLTCRQHNLLAARRIFGDELMDRYAPGRRRDER